MPADTPLLNAFLRTAMVLFVSTLLLALAACSTPGTPHTSSKRPEPPSSARKKSPPPMAAQDIDIWDRVRDGFAIDIPPDPQIEAELRWYLDHPLWLDNVLTRGNRYLFHILDEIERRGLPTELALLPVVESAFVPTAVSRSNAVGLWQFLSETGKDYGLQQTAWVDQRRDVVDSTRAALDYLATLARQFDGDWTLALAAYNGGPGYVSRLCQANLAQNRGRTRRPRRRRRHRGATPPGAGGRRRRRRRGPGADVGRREGCCHGDSRRSGPAGRRCRGFRPRPAGRDGSDRRRPQS